MFQKNIRITQIEIFPTSWSPLWVVSSNIIYGNNLRKMLRSCWTKKLKFKIGRKVGHSYIKDKWITHVPCSLMGAGSLARALL